MNLRSGTKLICVVSVQSRITVLSNNRLLIISPNNAPRILDLSQFPPGETVISVAQADPASDRPK